MRRTALLMLLLSACAPIADGEPTGETGGELTPLPPPKPLPPPDDANIVSAPLATFLPVARSYQTLVSLFPTKVKGTLDVFAVSTSGISTLHWDTDKKAWYNWVHAANPTPSTGTSLLDADERFAGWDNTLAVAPSGAAAGSDYDAFFSFRDANLIDHAAAPEYNLDNNTETASSSAPPAPTVNDALDFGSAYDFLNLPAVLTRFDASSGRTLPQAFGTGIAHGQFTEGKDNFAAIPVWSSLRRPGGQVFTNHGLPANANNAIVGPGSACSVIPQVNRDAQGNPLPTNPTNLVFVTTGASFDPPTGNFTAGSEVHVLHDDTAGNYAWDGGGLFPAMGAPSGAHGFIGAPLCITWYDGVPASGGHGHINLFLVGRDSSGQVKLFERAFDGTQWSGWNTYNPPASYGNRPFRLNTAAVWSDGNLRINAFGWADADPNSGKPEQLVEFFWNGGWNFGSLRTPPDNLAARTLSAVATVATAYTRISVFARSASGRIWEYAWQLDNGTSIDWVWNDLSHRTQTLTILH